MDYTIPYWVLLAAGGLLAMAELLIGTFVVLWFGVGLFGAGILSLLGVIDNAGFQLLVSAVMGTGMMMALRDKCTADGNGEKDELTTLKPGTGKLKKAGDGNYSVQINGTLWRIQNPEALPENAEDDMPVVVSGFEGTKARIASADEAFVTAPQQ